MMLIDIEHMLAATPLPPHKIKTCLRGMGNMGIYCIALEMQRGTQALLDRFAESLAFPPWG